MNQFLNNPELSLGLNFPLASLDPQFKANIGTKFSASWPVVMAAFAILFMFYFAGKLENKESGGTTEKPQEN